MAQPNDVAVTGITPEQLQQILAAVIAETKKLNPMEQQQLDDMLKAQARKDKMMIALAKAEEQAQWTKRNGCSHKRYPKSHDLAGHSAPKDELMAEWCTGGQAYQDGTAVLVCTRCSTVWRFRPTPDYYTQIVQNGLRGQAPPPPEHVMCEGCHELKHACKCDQIYRESMAVASV